MAIGIFNCFSWIFNAVFRLESILDFQLTSDVGTAVGSFEYTKEAPRVTRRTVESNYYFINPKRRVDDVNCFITLPIEITSLARLRVALGTVESSYFLNLNRVDSVNCFITRVALGTVESNYFLNLNLVDSVNCFITLPREISFSRMVKSCSRHSREQLLLQSWAPRWRQ